MRTLEVRRHSLTKKGAARGHGSHLSAAGVALARSVASAANAFDYILTSAAPRAVETAIAMGYAVDDTIDMASGYIPGVVEHHDQWKWPEPFVTYAEKLDQSAELRQAAQDQYEIWMRALNEVPDGGGALIISHGGSIEPALVTCLPSADHHSWGGAFSHCDGVRLSIEDSAIVSAEFDRARTT